MAMRLVQSTTTTTALPAPLLRTILALVARSLEVLSIRDKSASPSVPHQQDGRAQGLAPHRRAACYWMASRAWTPAWKARLRGDLGARVQARAGGHQRRRSGYVFRRSNGPTGEAASQSAGNLSRLLDQSCCERRGSVARLPSAAHQGWLGREERLTQA